MEMPMMKMLMRRMAALGEFVVVLASKVASWAGSRRHEGENIMLRVAPRSCQWYLLCALPRYGRAERHMKVLASPSRLLLFDRVVPAPKRKGGSHCESRPGRIASGFISNASKAHCR